MSYPVIPTDDDKAHFEKVASRGKERTGHADEGGWFAQWRKRVTMERMVIRKACRDAIAAGYSVSVYYERGEPELKESTDLAKVMETIMACDEEWLSFQKTDPATGKEKGGTVYLVYGNDGYDVMCDYHCCLEEESCDFILKGANELADKLADN